MSDLSRETAMKIELLNTLHLCREALQEAILIAPLDRIPDKAGSALQEVGYMIDKYSGR